MAQLSNVDNVLNNLKYLSTTYAGNMKRLENLLGHYASLFPGKFTNLSFFRYVFSQCDFQRSSPTIKQKI